MFGAKNTTKLEITTQYGSKIIESERKKQVIVSLDFITKSI